MPAVSHCFLQYSVKSFLYPNAQGYKGKPKFKYIYCFDKKLRKEWQAKALPYPKKAE